MNESMFFRAELPTQLAGLSKESQTLFESNFPALGSNQDSLQAYRNPPSEIRNTQNVPSDYAAHQLRYAQSEGSPLSTDSLVSSTQSEKENDSVPKALVIAAEVAAVAVFARIGLKHLAKNGITFFESAGSAARGLTTKLDDLPKPLSQTSIAELNQIRTTAVSAEHHLPRIRTFERETGPLRVG